MARLIDADKLKKQKTVLWDPALGFCDCVLVEDIDKAPTVDAVEVVHGRWFHVTEPPKKSGEYLTRCHHHRNGDWNEVVPFDVEKGYFVDLGKRFYPYVTHWMPLPEPPKEVE